MKTVHAFSLICVVTLLGLNNQTSKPTPADPSLIGRALCAKAGRQIANSMTFRWLIRSCPA